jgi:hypothetical protein
MAEEDAANVLDAVLSRAKRGDMAAAGMVMGRVWPARKGRPVIFDLTPLTTAGDLAAALGSIVRAVSIGELTPEEGQALGTMLAMQRDAIDLAKYLAKLEERIVALESKQDDKAT